MDSEFGIEVCDDMWHDRLDSQKKPRIQFELPRIDRLLHAVGGLFDGSLTGVHGRRGVLLSLVVDDWRRQRFDRFGFFSFFLEVVGFRQGLIGAASPTRLTNSDYSRNHDAAETAAYEKVILYLFENYECHRRRIRGI